MRLRFYTTAGLALVGAAVIIATPITAPPADLRVSASQFAGNADNVLLDPSFLDSMRGDSLQAMYPVAVVKQWLQDLLEDANLVGSGALSTSDPGPAEDSPSTLGTFAVGKLSNAVGPAVTNPRGKDLPAVVREALEQLERDGATFVSGQVVAAVFASAVAAAQAPEFLLGALSAAAEGDLSAAIDQLAVVATVTFGPPMALVDAIRVLVEQQLTARPAEDIAVEDPAPPEAPPGAAAPDHSAAPAAAYSAPPAPVQATPPAPEPGDASSGDTSVTPAVGQTTTTPGGASSSAPAAEDPATGEADTEITPGRTQANAPGGSDDTSSPRRHSRPAVPEEEPAGGAVVPDMTSGNKVTPAKPPDAPTSPSSPGGDGPPAPGEPTPPTVGTTPSTTGGSGTQTSGTP